MSSLHTPVDTAAGSGLPHEVASVEASMLAADDVLAWLGCESMHPLTWLPVASGFVDGPSAGLPLL